MLTMSSIKFGTILVSFQQDVQGNKYIKMTFYYKKKITIIQQT